MSEQKKPTEEPRVEGPRVTTGGGPGGRGPPLFGTEKAKLEHPRGSLWRWMLSYLRPFVWKYTFYLILLIVATIGTAYTPILARNLIDQGIIGTYNPITHTFVSDQTLILNIALIYLILVIFNLLANYISQYGMGKIGQVVVYSVRNNIINKLQQMSMSYFDRKSSGDIISITTNDVDQLNMLVSGQLVQIFTSAAALGITIVFMFWLNPYLALLSMIIFPIFFVALRVFTRIVSGLFKQTRKTISRVTSTIQENITGAKVVQAYGQQEKTAREFDEANEQNFQASYKVRKVFSTFFPLMQFITQFLTATILFAGGFSLVNGVSFLGIAITVGTLTSFVSYLSQLFQPVLTLTQVQNFTESAMAAADRIYGLLNEEVDLPEPENPLPFENIHGNIDFVDVSFGYKLVENGKATAEDASKKKGKKKRGKIEPVHIEEASPLANLPEFVRNRIESVLNQLPEPHKSFLAANIMNLPQDTRVDLMPAIMGGGEGNLAAAIDDALAKHGYAVPGSVTAREHPELKTTIEPSQESPVIEVPWGGKPGSQKPGAGTPWGGKPGSQKPGAGTPWGGKPGAQKPGAGAPWGGMNGKPGTGPGSMPPVNPDAIKNMINALEKMLERQASMPAASSGGEGGGMMGGGARGGNSKQLTRALSSMPVPAEMFEDFPDIVKKAIEEERILIDREQTVGYVLDHINVHVEAGNTLAIVGETGAGKTTMIKLIARFYDVNKGAVKIDDVDIRDVKKMDLRVNIGIVPQDSFLFTGTIRENLLYGIHDVTPEVESKAIEVSKFLGLHNFIEALPDKYETNLTENASNISIGQRQLMAFARALLADPKILILDEATSSVDPYTETLIQDALDRAREGRTTIIIAHRLSTIKNADQIIVISRETKGIVEEGTHDDLLAIPDGRYRRLLEMQQL